MGHDDTDGGIVKYIVRKNGWMYLPLYNDVATKRSVAVIRVMPSPRVEVGDTVWWDDAGAFLTKESLEVDVALGAYRVWTNPAQ